MATAETATSNTEDGKKGPGVLVNLIKNAFVKESAKYALNSLPTEDADALRTKWREQGIDPEETPGVFGKFAGWGLKAISGAALSGSYEAAETSVVIDSANALMQDQIADTVQEFRNGGLDDTISIVEKASSKDLTNTKNTYENIKELLNADDSSKKWHSRVLMKLLARGLSLGVPIISFVGARLATKATDKIDDEENYRNSFNTIVTNLIAKANTPS